MDTEVHRTTIEWSLTHLPIDTDTHKPEIVGQIIGRILSDAADLTEQIQCDWIASENLSRFCCLPGRSPILPIDQYIAKRLVKYTHVNSRDLITALILINRLLMREWYALTLGTLHRLFAVALVVVIKFTDDNCYKNNYYCTVTGMSLSELNELELVF